MLHWFLWNLAEHREPAVPRLSGYIRRFLTPKTQKKSRIFRTYSPHRGESFDQYSWNLQVSCTFVVYVSISNLVHLVDKLAIYKQKNLGNAIFLSKFWRSIPQKLWGAKVAQSCKDCWGLVYAWRQKTKKTKVFFSCFGSGLWELPFGILTNKCKIKSRLGLHIMTHICYQHSAYAHDYVEKKIKKSATYP